MGQGLGNNVGIRRRRKSGHNASDSLERGARGTGLGVEVGLEYGAHENADSVLVHLDGRPFGPLLWGPLTGQAQRYCSPEAFGCDGISLKGLSEGCTGGKLKKRQLHVQV